MTCKNFFTQNPGALMRNLKLTHLGNAKRSDSLFQGIYWGEIVSDAAASGIQAVQLATGVPIAFGVLTVESDKQALERSQGQGEHNVGEEAAVVSVQMVRLLQEYK